MYGHGNEVLQTDRDDEPDEPARGIRSVQALEAIDFYNKLLPIEAGEKVKEEDE